MLFAEHAALRERVAVLEWACSKTNDEVSQALGKALGYSWFKDDQANFPDATEADGVCVGDHVAESIADEAADVIAALREVALAVAPAFEQRNRRQMADWEIRTADALARLEAAHPGVLEKEG